MICDNRLCSATFSGLVHIFVGEAVKIRCLVWGDFSLVCQCKFCSEMAHKDDFCRVLVILCIQHRCEIKLVNKICAKVLLVFLSITSLPRKRSPIVSKPEKLCGG